MGNQNTNFVIYEQRFHIDRNDWPHPQNKELSAVLRMG